MTKRCFAFLLALILCLSLLPAGALASEEMEEVEEPISEIVLDEEAGEPELQAAEEEESGRAGIIEINDIEDPIEPNNPSFNSDETPSIDGVNLDTAFLWPVSSKRINALDHYSNGSSHGGIDIAASSGSTVSAVAAGTVVRIGNGCSHSDAGSGHNCYSNDGWGEYGNYIVLKHIINGSTYTSVYAHLKQNSLKVSVGSTVAAGQAIALSGSSGSSTGAHLHLEIYAGEFRGSIKDIRSKSFQYYQNIASVLSGMTFSGHVSSSSVYFGSWVQANCEKQSSGVWKYVGGGTSTSYYLDINGYLDTNRDADKLTGYGTVDVYINGKLVADDVSDYCEQWSSGTTYEIKDIKSSSGKYYWGVSEGSLSGTITKATTVRLHYSTAYSGGGQTIPNGQYMIASALDETKVLDIYKEKTENGTNVQLYAAKGIACQIFTVTYLGNGNYSIINSNSNQALNIQDKETTPGANVQIWEYSGNANSQWVIKDVGDGYYSIIARYSGLYLDVSGGETADETNIQVYTANGTDSQKFKFVPLFYTITFNANGGSGTPAAQTKTHGTALTLSSTKPTRDGYTFLGWATSSTATSAQYKPGAGYTQDADVTLYAVWQKNSVSGFGSFYCQNGTIVGTYNAPGGMIEVYVNGLGAQSGFNSVSVNYSPVQAVNTVEVYVDGALANTYTVDGESAKNTYRLDLSGITIDESGISGSGRIVKTGGNQAEGKKYAYIVINFEREDGTGWSVAGTYSADSDGVFDVPSINGVADRVSGVIVIGLDAKVGANWAGHNITSPKMV